MDPTGYIADDTFFGKTAKATKTSWSTSTATKVAAPAIVTAVAAWVILKNPALASRVASIGTSVALAGQQAATWVKANVWSAAARLVPGANNAVPAASKGYHAATAGGGGTTSGLPAVQPWPPDSGLLGGFKTTITLQPGTVVDRYGLSRGTHLSPLGTTFGQRSLPAHYEWTQPYYKYEVIKPLEVEGGISMPWFGQDGLGIEYKTLKPIELLVGEYLREIP